ncbi:MAG TPA: hypothetical protein ENI23_16890, partial [bacterium]|nr:hypothetical protein [bacterium]
MAENIEKAEDTFKGYLKESDKEGYDITGAEEDEVVSLDDEILQEGDLFDQASREEIMRARYEVADEGNWFDFHIEPFKSLAESDLQIVENDFFLDSMEPIQLFGQSIGALEQRYANYARVSAFDKKTFKYTDFIGVHQPKHGATLGGKGLTLYT